MGKEAIGTYQIRTKDMRSQKNQMFWPIRANLEIFNGGITTRRHSGTPNDVELVFGQIWPNDPEQIMLERLALGDALLRYRDNPTTNPALYQPTNNWIKAIQKNLPSELSFARLCLEVRVEYTEENEVRYPTDLTVIYGVGIPDQKFTFYEFSKLLSKLNMLFLLRSDLVQAFLVPWARSEQKSISAPVPGVLDNKAEASISWIEPIWGKYPYERPTVSEMGDEAARAYKNYQGFVDNDDDK